MNLSTWKGIPKVWWTETWANLWYYSKEKKKEEKEIKALWVKAVFHQFEITQYYCLLQQIYTWLLSVYHQFIFSSKRNGQYLLLKNNLKGYLCVPQIIQQIVPFISIKLNSCYYFHLEKNQLILSCTVKSINSYAFNFFTSVTLKITVCWEILEEFGEWSHSFKIQKEFVCIQLQ